jgi:cyclomaltodextrinase / maltogenic alpha-amylase / neopullulanase
MRVYEPAVTAVQLNLIGSHDTPRALTVLGADRDAFRIAALLQLTLPGAPCIYYGDEVGMEGRGDPDCRRGYPVQAEAQDGRLRAFVQAAIALRREHPALRRGTVEVAGAQRRAIAFVREADGQRALVVVNAGRASETISIDLPGPPWRRLRSIALPGWERPALEGPSPRGQSRLTLTLPPQLGVVFVEA